MKAGSDWFAAGLLAVGLSSGMAMAGAPSALAAASPGTIATVAGGPGRGPGLAVAQTPIALAAGPDGAVYVGDVSNVVRELTVTSSQEKVTAGVGNALFLESGDGGRATAAALNDPQGLAVDGAGNVVIADTDNARLRVVAARSGIFYGRAMKLGHIYSVAGNGTLGYSGDGGPATAAELDFPEGVAVDGAGNVVFVDEGNERIRVVAASSGTFYGQAMTAGDIYTVAGNGAPGYSGDGGPATQAELGSPFDVTADAAGNLVIADSNNERVRVVAASSGTFYSQAMTAGDIYTIAGNGSLGYSGDGGPATKAGLDPLGLTLDSHGNVVIADISSDRVRVVAVRSGTFYGQAMTAGDIYTVAGDGQRGHAGDGGPATSAALSPVAVTVDSAGNLVIADTSGLFMGNKLVRVVAGSSGTFYGQAMTAGDIYTVAGNGRAGSSGDRHLAVNAEIARPAGATVSDPGNILIADTLGSRIRVAAVRSGVFYGTSMTAGQIYTIAGTGPGYRGDGGPATSARVKRPDGVALDHAGNVVIADTGNRRVRMVAVRSGTFFGQVMTAGDIYTIAGDGKYGFSGDGGPATSAELFNPAGLVVDAAGNVVIADTGNSRVRVIAARTGTFYGQAMSAGDIYTIAGNGGNSYSGDGGPATSAALFSPQSVAVDAAGNIIIADTSDDRVRVVAARSGTFYGQAMTAGDIYTIAGNGGNSYSGDGGPAISASLSLPQGVAVDAAGNIVIADTDNGRIRVVAARSGTFYGQAMTAQDIYTVAGNGQRGFSGDGGPATSASLLFPGAVAVGPTGSLVIADTFNNRIRMVSY